MRSCRPSSGPTSRRFADTCGSQAYAEQHVTAPPWPGETFVAFRANVGEDGGGLGDRLNGLVTTFLAALLANRTFVPLMELPSDTYRWTVPTNRSRVSATAYADPILWFNNRFTFSSAFANNFSVIRANRGVSIRLFDSTHGDALRALGLQPAYAFGCVLNRLLRPADATLADFYEELAVLNDPAFFTVAIHIRAGDYLMSQQRRTRTTAEGTNLTSWHKTFECAQELEDAFADGRRVRWFFVSDSRRLRRDFQERFANKTPVQRVRTPGHVNKADAQATGTSMDDNFRLSVAEHWLFGMCDAFVIASSGFSKTAAARALLPEMVFWNDRRRPCTPGNSARLDELARWSGW
eukprot:TRINITY_DN3100_c0_g1_i2.p2 TRINITY_DN3100_c0_g1~~TRINITY_DN3100_c0_g1_i2.p2  ORF type:complete len:351 (+),score=112.90 TRINITY_DN3100_c0_g1_i2:1434-2486(+)